MTCRKSVPVHVNTVGRPVVFDRVEAARADGVSISAIKSNINKGHAGCLLRSHQRCTRPQAQVLGCLYETKCSAATKRRRHLLHHINETHGISAAVSGRLAHVIIPEVGIIMPEKNYVSAIVGLACTDHTGAAETDSVGEPHRLMSFMT